MFNIWSTEARAITIATLALVLLGLASGYWFIASLLVCVSYIAWLYWRLLKLEHWIRKGTKTSQVYEDAGFIGIIIRLLYEQKKVHIRRKRRTKQLLRRLNKNISALPDATVLLDRELNIDWCNEPAKYLLNLRSPQDLGYRLTNLIRDPLLLDYLEHPETHEHIDIQSPVDKRISIQIRLVSFGGNQSLLIARNVSDEKQLRQSLTNFVANASHELKSPLTVVTGHLEMLEDEQKLSASGMRSLQTAQRQAERMKELIQDQLLLSQLESYRLAPGEGERISISDLMGSVMAALDKYADHDRVNFDYADDLFVLGLEVELESICINLVENALKYTTPGTGIDARWGKNASGEYVFSVADQGPGIDAEDVTRLTERYYRGSKVRSEIAGSGLGLAIVKHAAGKLGAAFDIESVPGKGSCFSVTFPSYRCLQDEPEISRVIKLPKY